MTGGSARHRTKLRSTNTLEGMNNEAKRHADVVGIFPNEDSMFLPSGAVPLEASDEWQLRHRHMQIEGTAERDAPAAEVQSLIPRHLGCITKLAQAKPGFSKTLTDLPPDGFLRVSGPPPCRSSYPPTARRPRRHRGPRVRTWAAGMS